MMQRLPLHFHVAPLFVHSVYQVEACGLRHVTRSAVLPSADHMHQANAIKAMLHD